MKIERLHEFFFAEASGIDLKEDLDGDVMAEIRAALDKNAVLLFRDQGLSDRQQIAFSERLGPVATTRQADRPGFRLRVDPQMSDISNLDADGAVLGAGHRRRMDGLANRLWHTDHSFRRVPSTYSLLSAHIVPPEGGQTEFADMRAAYDALSPARKAELEGLVVEHSIYTSRAVIGFTDFSAEERAALPPARQPLVRMHPGSGRKSLYLAAHADRVEGMPTPEGKMLLLDLMDHATQPQFVYSHSWRPGDIVIWDNRCTMHRARAYDMTQKRDMRRTTVSETAPLLEQAAVEAAAAVR